jgi:hypothetical protein
MSTNCRQNGHVHLLTDLTLDRRMMPNGLRVSAGTPDALRNRIEAVTAGTLAKWAAEGARKQERRSIVGTTIAGLIDCASLEQRTNSTDRNNVTMRSLAATHSVKPLQEAYPHL